MRTSFDYYGTRLEYCTAEYNTARLNERAVEIPIARHFLGQVGGQGLEVGNVLAHYLPTVEHRVVDRYEPGAENIDVFDITGDYDWIIAISTIEHIRWDEPGPKSDTAATDAVRHLQGLLTPRGRMLVTVPFGWNPFLDSAILSRELWPAQQCTYTRAGPHAWRQKLGAHHSRYAATTKWAEAVWIAEFHRW